MTSITIKIITIFFVWAAILTYKIRLGIFKSFIDSINKCYMHVYVSLKWYVKVVTGIALLGVIITCLLISVEKCCGNRGQDVSIMNILMTMVVFVMTLVVLYLVIGIMTLLVSKIIDAIEGVEDWAVSAKMLISFVLILCLLLFSIAYEGEMKENSVCLLVGTVICYILNLQIMLKIFVNPYCVLKRTNDGMENKTLIFFCAVMMVVMMIATMYLFVIWADYSFAGAYESSIEGQLITKWSLFYYTIVSFTTVGYGDIVPIALQSQVVAVLIAITSVLCLIIFISSILSEKKSILKND